MGKVQGAQNNMGSRMIFMKIRLKDTEFCTEAENFNYIFIESSFVETDLAILLNQTAVEINFPSFSDGREFKHWRGACGFETLKVVRGQCDILLKTNMQWCAN